MVSHCNSPGYNISIHAPHARSDTAQGKEYIDADSISIHAPHARSDRGTPPSDLYTLGFQSTLLMRGAT